MWAVVFKYASVEVPAGKTIRFINHGSRAPVVWLAQASVTIRGIVSLTPAASTNPPVSWPEPGPGGFRGGGPATSPAFPPGVGPGGGQSAVTQQNGNYAGPGDFTWSGPAYGSPTLFPLIGGSGASTTTVGAAGGPGGGAILIAANERVESFGSGVILARFGTLGSGANGSGGAVRLVANVINLQPTVPIDAWSSASGSGRIRLEANQFQGFVSTSPPASIGTPGPIFPDSMTPAVRVVSVTIGGLTYPVPADPRASFSFPQADVIAAMAGSAQVELEARNIAPGRFCQVRVANPIGSGALWTNSTPLAGTTALSTATATVPLAVGLHAMQVRVVL